MANQENKPKKQHEQNKEEFAKSWNKLKESWKEETERQAAAEASESEKLKLYRYGFLLLFVFGVNGTFFSKSPFFQEWGPHALVISFGFLGWFLYTKYKEG